MGGLWGLRKVGQVLSACAVFFLSPAWARRDPPPVQQTAKTEARSQLQEGLDALTARDIAGAEQKICAAYLETPSPDGLYALAQLRPHRTIVFTGFDALRAEDAAMVDAPPDVARQTG